MSPERVVAEVDGKRLSLSNLEKVLWPETGFTKGEMIHYYAQIADVMLPHIQDRPITLKRFPNGVDGMAFFEKHASSHRPDWIRTIAVPSASQAHDPIEFALIGDRPTLLWAANLAAIEFHVPLWRVGRSGTLPAPPTHMVFDLDPGPGTTIVECCRVAQWIREHLGDRDVFPKTSGSKGLQLYTPLHRVSAERAGKEAHQIAQAIETDHGDAVVSLMRKELRKNKVLIDWSQNNPSKTTVAAYSLRARPEPTVSTPVTWDEVAACEKSGDPNDLRFAASDVLERVNRLGDLMAGLLPRTRARATKS